MKSALYSNAAHAQNKAFCRIAAVLFAILAPFAALAARYDLSQKGVELVVETSAEAVSPAEDFIVTVTAVVPAGAEAELPDLRGNFKGFRVAEDFEDPPQTRPDGSRRLVSHWRLAPDASAKKFRLSPFAVGDLFLTKNIVFPPPSFPAAAGEIEISPERIAEPMSWGRVGMILLWAIAALALAAGLFFALRFVHLKIKIHRMSPYQRARWELAELLKAELPRKGLFKEFYIRLTMVVRRYISRRFAISAPQLTTDEFLRQAAGNEAFAGETLQKLQNFLENADLVKFAGLQATEDMAARAVQSAEEYLESASKIV